MDLSALEPLDVRDRIDKTETQAITVRKRRNDALVRVSAGSVAGLGTMAGGIALILAALKAFAIWSPWLVIPAIFLGALAVTLASMVAAGYFLAPPERRLLAAVIEPEAGEFVQDNWQRRGRLLAEAEAFNEALASFKALPERAGQDEVDEGVIANLAERRARIEAETEAYLAQFRAATEEERTRVAKANAPRKKSGDSHRRPLRDFNRKVKKLKRLERSLDGLMGSVSGGTTVDLSPYLAAQRFRAELEEERATLIRCGFKPRKLPAPHVGQKFLPKPV